MFILDDASFYFAFVGAVQAKGSQTRYRKGFRVTLESSCSEGAPITAPPFTASPGFFLYSIVLIADDSI